MKHLERLRRTVGKLGKVDCFQYVAASRQPLDLPSDIRIIVRRRRAAELGHTVHDQYTLVVAMHGDGGVHIDDHRLRLAAGEALLIHPSQVHEYMDESRAPVEWLFCTFHHPLHRWDAMRGMPVPISPQVADDLAALIADHFLDTTFGKRRTALSEQMSALRLHLILSRLHADLAGRIAPAGDGAVDRSHQLVQKVVQHVREHLADHLSIAGIARSLHLSPGHLRNEFHRLVGVGIGRYIRTARVRHACILLDTTDLTMAEIGRRCGYDSIFSFSRAFKADKGVPPTTYRTALKPVH